MTDKQTSGENPYAPESPDHISPLGKVNGIAHRIFRLTSRHCKNVPREELPDAIRNEVSLQNTMGVRAYDQHYNIWVNNAHVDSSDPKVDRYHCKMGQKFYHTPEYFQRQYAVDRETGRLQESWELEGKTETRRKYSYLDLEENDYAQETTSHLEKRKDVDLWGSDVTVTEVFDEMTEVKSDTGEYSDAAPTRVMRVKLEPPAKLYYDEDRKLGYRDTSEVTLRVCGRRVNYYFVEGKHHSK